MRSRVKQLLVLGLILATPMVAFVVIGWRRDAQLEKLSAALDRDLLEFSRKTFPRPPILDDPVEGTGLEYFKAAWLATPPCPGDWNEIRSAFLVDDALTESALTVLAEAQAALTLLSKGARAPAAGRWYEYVVEADGKPGGLDMFYDLTMLASMDATRLLDAGAPHQAVDRCLAAIRRARDEGRHKCGSLGVYAMRAPLDTLARLGDRLPAAEIDRAVAALSLELSIPDSPKAHRLKYLAVECTFRNALQKVGDDLYRWGHMHHQDAQGDLGYHVSRSGFPGAYERTTCLSRVRSWVPDAWVLLREEMARRKSTGTATTAFEEECGRSTNPVLVQLGHRERRYRLEQEHSRVELEATILALLALKHRQVRGEFPDSIEEVRPPSIRPKPNGNRWRLRPEAKTGRPGIWLVPFSDKRPVRRLGKRP